MILEIKNAIEQQDLPKLEISAHSYKGAISNFFAKDIQKIEELKSICFILLWIGLISASNPVFFGFHWTELLSSLEAMLSLLSITALLYSMFVFFLLF